MNSKRLSIVIADDDPDDRQLLEEALKEARLSNPVHFVSDGDALLRYLNESSKLPALILLDLNMPKKDGKETLVEIRANPRLKQIPVVILTTSKTESDILSSYKLGVNSFIVKPVTFSSLVNVIQELTHYWFEVVELPSPT